MDSTLTIYQNQPNTDASSSTQPVETPTDTTFDNVDSKQFYTDTSSKTQRYRPYPSAMTTEKLS